MLRGRRKRKKVEEAPTEFLRAVEHLLRQLEDVLGTEFRQPVWVHLAGQALSGTAAHTVRDVTSKPAGACTSVNADGARVRSVVALLLLVVLTFFEEFIRD